MHWIFKDIHGKSRETFIIFTIFKKHLKKTQSHETLRSGGKKV